MTKEAQNGCTKKHMAILGAFVTIMGIVLMFVIPALAYSKADGARLEERVKNQSDAVGRIEHKLDRLLEALGEHR